MAEAQKHRFTCYPTATLDNPLLGIPVIRQDGTSTIANLPGSKYDPLVVELYTGGNNKPHVKVFRNGLQIAHSAVELKPEVGLR
jgi:hypothetical protein